MKTIDEVNDLIVKKLNGDFCEIKYNNCIFTGKNMSGKSYMIKNFIKNNYKVVYYIDSINRVIPIDNPANNFNVDMVNDININRINKNNFNKKDVFTETINNSMILNELIENIKEYTEIISDYFGLDFNIKEKIDNFNNVYYIFCFGKDEYSEISSGFHAIIRILVEVVFANKANRKCILIDEIDAHLDNENCNKLMEFLNLNFPNIVFLLSTHSADIILRAKNYNIININRNDSCEIYDSNDMDDLNYINRVLFSINKRSDFKKSENDKILGDYIRNLANGYTLNRSDIDQINNLIFLTTKQLVLKEYILRWNER